MKNLVIILALMGCGVPVYSTHKTDNDVNVNGTIETRIVVEVTTDAKITCEYLRYNPDKYIECVVKYVEAATSLTVALKVEAGIDDSCEALAHNQKRYSDCIEGFLATLGKVPGMGES